jgi:hypothetical protein
MPRKARSNSPSVIQVVGGSSAGFMPPMALPPPMDPFSATLLTLNANPYIIGVFYIFLNLGGRFLTMELTKRQEWFLGQPFMRPFILFCVMFVATRNLATAFWATGGILAVLWFFANENSALCLIPEWRNDKEKKEQEDKAYEEKMKAVQKHTDGHDIHHDDNHTDANHADNHDDVHHDEAHHE